MTAMAETPNKKIMLGQRLWRMPMVQSLSVRVVILFIILPQGVFKRDYCIKKGALVGIDVDSERHAAFFKAGCDIVETH